MTTRRIDTSDIGMRIAQMAVGGSLLVIPCFATLSTMGLDVRALLAIASWLCAMVGLCVLGFSIQNDGHLLGIALGDPAFVRRDRLVNRLALQGASILGVAGCLYQTVVCFL